MKSRGEARPGVMLAIRRFHGRQVWLEAIQEGMRESRGESSSEYVKKRCSVRIPRGSWVEIDLEYRWRLYRKSQLRLQILVMLD